MAGHIVRHAPFGGSVRAPHPRKDRAGSGESTLSQDGARGRLPFRGAQVRNRIFFKVLAAFALVVVVTAFTLDTSIRRAWETSLRDEIQRNLTQKTLLLAQRVEIDRQHACLLYTSDAAD